MASEPPPPITRLLQDVSAGNADAKGVLLEQVYSQLRAIAQERMSHERKSHTLQATALVHEAYMRLLSSPSPGADCATWRDRAHFYRAAAEAMRRILIDHARSRGRVKRGGEAKRVPINVCDIAELGDASEILALDEAISRLQEEDESSAEIVRFRFFAGLSVEQTAAALGLSERTVKREWSYARARLFHLLEQLELNNDG